MGPSPMVQGSTSQIEREITSVIKNSSIPQDTNLFCLYGLPEIHEPNVPLRLIFNLISTPTYQIAKYMAKILIQFTGKMPSHLLYSLHFVNLISHNVLISFDVSSRPYS